MDASSLTPNGASLGATLVAGVPVRAALVVNTLGFAGAERQVLSLAEHFDRARIDATVITLKNAGELKDVVAAAGLPTWSPEAVRGLDVPAVLRLATHLREREYRVALCTNQYSTLLTLLARRIARVPLPVFSAFHSSPQLIKPDARSQCMLRIYGWALRACSGLIYVSDLQREAWGALNFARTIPSVVIKNGIDVDRFTQGFEEPVRQRFGWTEREFVVGLCAALRPEKRVEDLVVAIRMLAEAGVPVRLLIVGDGPCRSAIESACAAQLGSGRYAMVGMQRDVVPFIHSCDVMALVSETEAFSISVLEAMACAKPVVLTDVGGAREQVHSGIHGYVVPPREPAAVAARLEAIWREGSATVLGAAARARVATEFSVCRMVSQYADLLTQGVLAARSSPPMQSGAADTQQKRPRAADL